MILFKVSAPQIFNILFWRQNLSTVSSDFFFFGKNFNLFISDVFFYFFLFFIKHHLTYVSCLITSYKESKNFLQPFSNAFSSNFVI